MNLTEAQKVKKKSVARLAQYHIKTKTFTGPFDVLLNLISLRKIDVAELDLSSLTKDYLDFLRQNAEHGIQLAPEFIRVAALLVYIKTKAILEDATYPEELEGLPQTESELIESLKILKEASKIAEIIQERLSTYSFSFPCGALSNDDAKRKTDNLNLTIHLDEIINMYLEAIKRQPISIKEKFVGTDSFNLDYFVSKMLDLLKKTDKCSIFEITKAFGLSRHNLIGVFLSALKMQQEGRAVLIQHKEFSDIEIFAV